VITDHLVDERSPGIVRLQRELSAANERLLVAVPRQYELADNAKISESAP